MHIDIERLIKDRDKLERMLSHTCNFRKHAEMGPYLSSINEMLMTLSPNDVHPELVRDARFERQLLIHRKRLALKHIDFLEKNEEFIIRMLGSYNDILDECDFSEYLYFDTLKTTFTEEEFKNMIYDFYSLFGNAFYKICKKYFDEGRIEMGYSIDYELGGFLGISAIKSGYIIAASDDLGTANMSTIIHEFGHAHDAEMFLFPQQKKINYNSDYLGEIPAIFFELMFIEYMKKNRIDGEGHSILLNERIDFYSSFEGIFKTYYASDCGIINFDGDVELDNGDKFDIYQSIVYALGSYFALHMCELYRSGDKNFQQNFLNFISRRRETMLPELVNMLGISLDEFLSGEIIKPRIVENSLVLKKRFG